MWLATKFQKSHNDFELLTKLEKVIFTPNIYLKSATAAVIMSHVMMAEKNLDGA